MLWKHLGRARSSLRFAARLFHPRAELGELLWQVAQLERRPEEEVAADLLAFALLQRQEAEADLERWRALSEREQEVAALACAGLTNAEIADRLIISLETVKSHMHHILGKFNLRRKDELRYALWGWDFSAYAGLLPEAGRPEEDAEDEPD
jgi:ATP/maltotriose-dependent transcriptional regulator MalT